MGPTKSEGAKPGSASSILFSSRYDYTSLQPFHADCIAELFRYGSFSGIPRLSLMIKLPLFVVAGRILKVRMSIIYALSKSLRGERVAWPISSLEAHMPTRATAAPHISRHVVVTGPEGPSTSMRQFQPACFN